LDELFSIEARAQKYIRCIQQDGMLIFSLLASTGNRNWVSQQVQLFFFFCIGDSLFKISWFCFCSRRWVPAHGASSRR